jgi:hypothetical protein
MGQTSKPPTLKASAWQALNPPSQTTARQASNVQRSIENPEIIVGQIRVPSWLDVLFSVFAKPMAQLD